MPSASLIIESFYNNRNDNNEQFPQWKLIIMQFLSLSIKNFVNM